MSRILKRPMFRIGGSTNEGIMSHVVPKRANYADPTGAANPLDNYQLDTESDLYKKAIRNAAIMNQFAGSGRSEKDKALDLLLRGSIRLASEKPAGNIFSTAAKAFQEPVDQYLKSGEAEDTFQRQLRLAGLTQALSSEEAQNKYDKELSIAKMKLEQDAKEAFIKSNPDLRGKAEGVFDTIKQLEKNKIPVSKFSVESVVVTGKGGVKTAKPNPQDVATIPEGKVFYDNYGNFYKRVKEGQGWVRVQTSGQEIPAPQAPVKQPSFFESPGAAYDPRSWNKKRFYEELANKNKPNME
jgi:hypothetical protein